MRHTKQVFILVLGLVAVLYGAFLPLNTYAVDLSVGIGFHASGQNPQWHDDTNTTSGNWHTGRWVYGGNSGNANGFESFSVRQNSGSNLPIYSSYYLELTGRIQFAGRNDKWNTSGWWIYSEVGNCAIIDFDSTEVQTHLDTSSVDNTIQVFNYNLICKYTGSDGGVPRIGLQVNSGSSTVSYQFSVLNWFIWKNAQGYDDSQVIAAINNVRNAANTINSTLGQTNLKLDDLSDSLNDIKTLQEDANQQQQDQYDAEKQEESQREQDMNGQSSDAQGMFNFSVLNPFSGLFGLFSSGCSVSIPILSSWLHAPSSTYTSWWCGNSTMTNIKNTLTPVMGISSMMLLFGFVVRWLSHNSGDIYGARNMNKGLNG